MATGRPTRVDRRAQVDPSVVAFGRRVRHFREERRLTQFDLANATGIDRAVIGFIERGEREVGISKVRPLADALNVSAADLFS